MQSDLPSHEVTESDVVEDESSKEDHEYGCEHYKRKCAFITPCCSKEYICRVCHDEKETHIIDRTKVMLIKCLVCGEKQKVQAECGACSAVFGKYFCEICRLFDNIDKEQFHCPGCGICRVGGQDNFYHCPKCDLCIPVTRKETHKCVEKASRDNCPICMEYLHTSRVPCHIPSCGHLMHEPCFKDLMKSGNYACPMCNESLCNMKAYWEFLDEEIENTPMPDEYKDTMTQILCRDCHKESRVLLHVLGLKCQECGSYNTARAAEPEPSAKASVESHGAAGDAK